MSRSYLKGEKGYPFFFVPGKKSLPAPDAESAAESFHFSRKGGTGPEPLKDFFRMRASVVLKCPEIFVRGYPCHPFARFPVSSVSKRIFRENGGLVEILADQILSSIRIKAEGIDSGCPHIQPGHV